MDEFFGEISCKFGSDSIMMKLLKSSMDKALERLKSKDGPIERLNERSKFYELAIIQLEGSLKLVQEGTDSYILESSHEVLSDLMKIKDRLRGRLKETKLAIIKKDREFKERVKNESMLRRALELKERELASLHASLQVAKTKTDEGVHELEDQPNQAREEDICELKTCMDQQFWNIKQQLEDERMKNFGPSNLVSLEDDSDMESEERSWHSENKEIEVFGSDESELAKPQSISLGPEHNRVIERMSSDIDILKGTLDLTFARMQIAEVQPLEKQWRWMIEKDTFSILIRGFMDELQHKFGAELSQRASQVPVDLFSELWSGLLNDITSLRRELVAFGTQDEAKGRTAQSHSSLATSLPCLSRTCSEPLPETYYLEEQTNGNSSAADSKHHVAKMIKSHESIMRKQGAKLHWLRRRKVFSSSKTDEDQNGMERRIGEVIQSLDSVIQWNAKLGSREGLCHKDHFQEEETGEGKMGIDTSADVCKRVGNASICHGLDASSHDMIRQLKEERDDSDLYTMAMEEVHIILSKGLLIDFYLELCDYEIKSLIKDDVCSHFFREVVNEWNISIQSKCFGSTQVEDKTHQRVHLEPTNKVERNYVFTLAENQDGMAEGNMEDAKSSCSWLTYLESTLREDVYAIFFREMVKEWKEDMESQTTESFVKEHIYHTVTGEALIRAESTCDLALGRDHEVRAAESFLGDFPCSGNLAETMESLLREDVYMVFFREIIKAWSMEREAYDLEHLIREEIFLFVIVEALKNADVLLSEIEALGEELQSAYKKIGKGLEVVEEKKLIQKLTSLLKCFKVKEIYMPSANSEIRENSAKHEPVGVGCEEMDEHDTSEWLLRGGASTSSSVCNKLEKQATQQLVMNKAILRELGNNLSIAAGDQGILQDHINPIIDLTNDSQIVPICSRVIMDFELMVHKKLEMNCMRLKAIKYELDLFAQVVSSLRKKKMLYEKAFVRRCHNLQLAEKEVDLLGDQVETLLGLLEKIYLILNQHSPVLSHYFRVSDILKLIRKELLDGASSCPSN